jgi:ribosomal-protein-alanine N-acetyltransferase
MLIKLQRMRHPTAPAPAPAPRIMLRHPSAEDAGEFTAAARASSQLHQPWVTAPSTPDQFRAFLARLDGDAFTAFLACRTEDEAITGYFTVSNIIRGSLHSAFLGYAAFAPFAGRGYMTDGLRLVLRVVFLDLRLHRLEANIQPGNASSIALVRRCGFQREGFSPRYLNIGGAWRDHERWAIRSEIWRDEGS